MSDNIVSIEEHNCLNSRGGDCFKLGIAASEILQRLGDQGSGICSICILSEGKQNVLYHVCVSLDSSGGSAAKYEVEVHFALLIKNCVAALCLSLGLFFLFLVKALLTIVLNRLEGHFLSILAV